VLAPFLAPRAATGPLPPQLRSSEQRPTVEALVTMCHWMHENIAYEPRETGDPFDPEVTLSIGRGSCRDFAVLFAEVLRANGIAARLASGFLWEDPSPESPVHSESQLHAWTEAYVPGAGWIGLDPTNGVFCDHHFLVTAVGITSRDIAPISGYYYGKKDIPSTMETELVIKRS
jgi:transglutaminase-like putative cysteine protease